MFEYVESVTLEGALEKQGKLKTWSWRKYWFVLDEDQLCYYKDSQRASAVGLIDLAQAKSVKEIADVNHGFPFEISTSLRSHVLAAETKEYQQTWIKALEHAMVLSWRRSSSMFRASCHSISDDEDISDRIKDFKVDENLNLLSNNKEKSKLIQSNSEAASLFSSKSKPAVAPKPGTAGGKLQARQVHKSDKYRRCVSAGPIDVQLKLPQSGAVMKGMSNSDGAVNKQLKMEEKITYPLSILRKTPTRIQALKSCSDIIVGDDTNVEENDMQSSGSDTWNFESPTMKLFKKSQHFLANDTSLPYRKSQESSPCDESEGKRSSHSPTSGVRRKVKIAHSRDFIKSMTSPTLTSKSSNPLSSRNSSTNSELQADENPNESDYDVTALHHLDLETISDSLTKDQLDSLKEYMKVDFPPIPELPNPRLELTFNSPFDSIRVFLAQNRGPMEIYPIPRKSERGGKAIRGLKTMLNKLERV